jgi:hypothetical protein
VISCKKVTPLLLCSLGGFVRSISLVSVLDGDMVSVSLWSVLMSVIKLARWLVVGFK